MNVETVVFSTLIFMVGFLLGERSTKEKKDNEEQNND